LDTDFYESTKIELEVLYPLLVEKGVLIIDDYGNPRQEVKRAIDDKVKEHNLKIDKFIGEDDGYICVHGLVFNDREAVIINLK